MAKVGARPRFLSAPLKLAWYGMGSGKKVERAEQISVSLRPLTRSSGRMS